MVEVLALAGGTLAVGVHNYFSRRTDGAHARTPEQNLVNTIRPSTDAVSPLSGQAHSPNQAHADAPRVDAADGATDGNARRNLQAASLSLGLATTGLLFPPAQFAAVPTLIYMGIPAAQEAYVTLRHDRRTGRALGETVALAGCLAGGFYLIGSLGFSLYYLGRTFQQRRERAAPGSDDAWQLPETVTLHRARGATTVARHELEPGDRFLVRSGEVIPVDGLIVDGSGLVKSAGLADATEQMKQSGDSVSAMDVVTLGALCVQMRRAH